MTNVKEIGDGFYIVRTQAGFRDLAKKYDVYNDDELTKYRITNEV